MEISLRYSHTAIKRYDGIEKGSSSLWGARILKGYGFLFSDEENYIQSTANKFDYSKQQVELAKKRRSSFYQRLLNPEEIKMALYNSPVTLDLEIFSSIFNDYDGEISLPDLEEDIKEDIAHSVSVCGHVPNGYIIMNNWVNWGRKGLGCVSLDYLKKYFITAFATSITMFEKRPYLERKKVKIKGVKYSYTIYKERNFLKDNRTVFNIEIFDAGGTITGWLHCFFFKKQIEILEIFVLLEFRRRGLGTFLLKKIIDFLKCSNITGFISGYDLLEDREEILKSFFIKNDLTVVGDRSRFKDCKFRIIKL